MDITQPIAIFWFRRDLRLNDNTALFKALTSGLTVLPIFIFDKNIVDKLSPDDKRISFIYQAIEHINQKLQPYKCAIQVFSGSAETIFEQLLATYQVAGVFANHDYEPYAVDRDKKVKFLLSLKGVLFHTYKDQVIFEKSEIVKPGGEPYTVFTPYSKRWLEKLKQDDNHLHNWNSENYLFNFAVSSNKPIPGLKEIGFTETKDVFHPFVIRKSVLETYKETRDYPAQDSTSKVSTHLRFGTVSVRHMVAEAMNINPVWLNEFIWREFFMQILWHFPHVINQPFKPKYQFINWINNEKDFDAWCRGQTGFPLVDAGMRELNETGFMHNRVRMITASFLVKHLLVNWQWGEAYFAGKLMDYELSSNNGNWQWSAGTGCDAAPYFRIFNPVTQAVKFDPQGSYIKKWIPEYNSAAYSKPILDHNFARNRCLETYKSSL